MDNRATKRPRPVLSCLQCRHRKLKCDRSKPCEQCVKAGRPDNCTFADGHDPPSTDFLTVESERTSDNGTVSSQGRKRPHTGSPDEVDGTHQKSEKAAGMVDDLLYRVKFLEDRLSLHAPANSTGAPGQSSSASNNASKYLGNMDVDRYRYIYRSVHQRGAITTQFGEIKPFLNKASEDPRIGAVVRDVARMQKIFARQYNSYAAQPVPDVKSALAQMVDLIPSRFVCDILAEAYYSHWEKTLRVLHVPTFRREYEAFWEGENRTMNISPGFVPQLLAVLAIAFRMHRESRAFLDRGFAYSCYAMLKAWQNQLTGRERSSFSNLQGVTLVVILGMMLPHALDKMWMETGALVRHAITLGIHLEPVRYEGQISVFHGQLRRRLWATILELDIQASLISTMPTTIRADSYSSLPPENIDDADLVEDMKQLPMPQAWDEWTPTLPQIVLAKSASWRLRAAEMISRQTPTENDQEEMSRISQGISETLESQPLCLRLDIEGLSSTRYPERLASLILLDLFNKRALIMLWRPIFFTSRWQTKMMIRHSFVNCCVELLSYHNALSPSRKDVDALDPRLPWAIIQNMCQYDLALVALSVCMEIKCMNELLSNPDQNSPSSLLLLGESSAAGGAAHQPSTLKSKSALVAAVKTTLDLLIAGIADHGNEVKNVLMLWAILESVRTSHPPGKSAYVSMMEELMRNVNACRESLQLEKGMEERYADEFVDPPPGTRLKPLGYRAPVRHSHPPANSNHRPHSAEFGIDLEAGVTGFENFFSFDDMGFDFGEWQSPSWL